MAQLGARFHGMEEVIGSIPIRSTNNPPKISEFCGWLISARSLRALELCLARSASTCGLTGL